MNLADDDFTLLALPQQYAINSAELQARWKAALTTAHPDRFSQAGAAGQRLAMQWSVRLNEAYQRLKHPLKRAEYLCALRGVKVDAERNTAMPAAFLMQQMEWREALQEARQAQDEAALTQLESELQAQKRELLATIGQHLDAQNFIAAAGEVRCLMFVAKFGEEVAQAFDALSD